MPIRRVFLDWQRPAPTVAAEWLLAGRRRGRCVDLRRATIVVPGRRAGRRLLEVLVAECAEQKLVLNPPQITTEGSFPEQLYTPQKPFANKLTQQAAWARALAETPAELRSRIAPFLTASDRRRQLQLGEMLRKQHAELAADGLDFADVARQGAELEDFDEVERWQAMAKVQRKYLDILDEYKLWDVQSARLEAVKRREPQTDSDIFLLGTVDLNQTLRDMLDLVADRVTALICAPEALADRFDKHGCLLPAEWAEAPIPLRDEQLFRADGPADQAAEAARLIAELKGTRRADEITIGVADENLVPQLQRQLHECGVPTRWVIGTPLAETAPYRFLTAVGEYAADREFSAFAALVRHPDVYVRLYDVVRDQLDSAAANKLLTLIDNYYSAHLPITLDGDWRGKEEEHREIKLAAATLDELLAPLIDVKKPRQTKTLLEWAAAVRQAFALLYTRKLEFQNPPDRVIIETCREIEKVLQSFALVPEGLQPPLTLRDALPLVLEPLGGEAIPPAALPEAVEMLGWLELALDDAPVLIVTTFNEGFLPKSRGADAFLPNRLREHLGLLNNVRVYARDAYAVQAILGSRPNAAFIVGRRDADRNPLAPSRLLFAAEPDVVIARAGKFFRELPTKKVRRVPLSRTPAPERSRFDVPRAVAPDTRLEQISVTQFRAYLACKYRYYLQYALNLRDIADTAEELEPGHFGDLVHDVLQDFGRQPEFNTCPNEKVVYGYLEERLEARVGGRYGARGRRGAVHLQVEQIRTRLKGFAGWQAKRANEGWQIVFTEDFEQRLETFFAVDDATIKLRGRIDRIDWHPERKTLQVLDYKTSDRANDPTKVHVRDGQWVDLQLPLYRHLLSAIELPSVAPDPKLEFGYIQLPKDTSRTALARAFWSEGELASADEAAREVIRGIWNGDFEPPTDPPPEYSDTFACICQDRLLDRVRPELELEEDDA